MTFSSPGHPQEAAAWGQPLPTRDESKQPYKWFLKPSLFLLPVWYLEVLVLRANVQAASRKT